MKKLTIKIPALKRPTLKEIQEKYSWVKSIEKDTSTEDAVTMTLISPVKKGEPYISGSEYEKRIPKTAILGFQHMQYLEEHQAEFPELLEAAKANNFLYITFPGLVVVREDGDRHVPYLSRSARRAVVWRLALARPPLRFPRSRGRRSQGSTSDTETLGISALKPFAPWTFATGERIRKRYGENKENHKDMKKLTSAEDAIKQAIEGGWKPNWKMKKDWRVEYSVLPGIRIYDNDTTIYSSWLTYAEIFTDPLFWIALGKVRGWDIQTTSYIMYPDYGTQYSGYAHQWLQTRLSNGDETKFWQNLP